MHEQYYTAMQTTSDTSTAPEQLFYKPLWLEACEWSVVEGFPSPAADHTQKRIDLNDHLIRNKEATYLFKVKGDSMTGSGIYEGDTLLVDRSIDPKHNWSWSCPNSPDTLTFSNKVVGFNDIDV